MTDVRKRKNPCPGGILIAACALLLSFGANALSVNDSAPDFDLPDQNERRHQLADYTGTWLVLYFYPKDDSPACTTEACKFRDDFLEIQSLGAKILGVSTDNSGTHAEFVKKYGLPFPLLADVAGDTAKAYDSLLNLGLVKFAKRRTFIISPQGKIAKIYTSVDPKAHSRQVIDDLKLLIDLS